MANNKPNYQIRPSKHVERKIFVDTLQHLRKVGYKLSDYHYVGFGSYFYMDYTLFNRHLAIEKMTSLENDPDIEKRIKFNKPYSFIDVKMDEATQFISTIRNNKPYLIWLDYECTLNEEILTDFGTLLNTLKNGSVIIVSVNAEVRLNNAEFLSKAEVDELKSKQLDQLVERYTQQLDPYCGTVKKKDVTPKTITSLFARTMRDKVKDSLKGRLDDSFHQLFNYHYRDGMQMYTFGGVIDSKDNSEAIKDALAPLNFINSDTEPTRISIPVLTAREKLWMDRNISKIAKNPKKVPFELDAEQIKDYIKYSKHHPSYYEVFMN